MSTRWATLSVKADTESADELMHQFAEDLEKYGEENDISRKIYNEYPSELDCGVTDIISKCLRTNPMC